MKSQTARIAALDYHRCCLPGAPEAAQREEIRLRGRMAYREALQTSYAVELQGPEEVAAWVGDCIVSLRDLLTCAEEHEARAVSGPLNSADVVDMDEQITACSRTHSACCGSSSAPDARPWTGPRRPAESGAHSGLSPTR